MVHFEIIFDMF